MERYVVSPSWLLRKLKVTDWLRDRVFHIPEKFVDDWCALLSKATGLDITVQAWRTIEANLAKTVTDGVLLRVKR